MYEVFFPPYRRDRHCPVLAALVRSKKGAFVKLCYLIMPVVKFYIFIRCMYALHVPHNLKA